MDKQQEIEQFRNSHQFKKYQAEVSSNLRAEALNPIKRRPCKSQKANFTQLEREVLRYILRDDSEIVKALFLNKEELDGIIENLRDKLGVHRKDYMLLEGIKKGIVNAYKVV